MGIIKRGILGGFRKTTGTVSGSYWRGQDVIRALPRSSGKAPTQEQLDQRFKFGLITSLLSWISNVIDVGYRAYARIPTPMNKAVSYNLKEAITGASPNFSIDPAKLSFSRGRLSLPSTSEVIPAAAAVLDFGWADDGEEDKFSHADDYVSLVVYNPVQEKFVSLINAATRADVEYSMQLPLTWSGEDVHCYMSLSAPKGKGTLCSETMYVGEVAVL